MLRSKKNSGYTHHSDPNSCVGIRLVSAEDVHFLYTRSHLNALISCALFFTTNFLFILTFK